VTEIYASPKRLRVGLLVSNVSRLGGGVSTLVIKLASALRNTCIEPVIFSAHDRYVDEDTDKLKNIKVISRAKYGPRAINYLPGLLGDLLQNDLDILHLHGIWQYPSLAGSIWMQKTRRPYIVSPHGMLDEWILRRNRARKWLAMRLYEKRNLSLATVVHALNAAESDQIRRFAPAARIELIPNGIETIGREKRVFNPGGDLTQPYVLYLGRIHPKKNLECAIDAWESLSGAEGYKGLRFVIAGWGEQPYVAGLLAKIALLGPGGRIDFIGPVYGEQKQRILEGAAFSLLPSLSEGLPMTILEAWAAGTPTLMSINCNLSDGFTSGAAIDCGTSVHSISATFQRVLRFSPEERQVMSTAALNLVKQKYSMTAITERWKVLYYKSIANANCISKQNHDCASTH
jgi:poly(glycerol-phosphate) alpha-glucosyltransferase